MDLERILSHVDRKLMVDLSKEFIETPSPTGEEEEYAKVLVRALTDVGLDAKLQMVYDGRFNAAGRLRGQGGGPTVLFSGHLDTSVRGDEEWLTGVGFKNKAVVVDDKWIYGNGIYNMKNAHVCYIAAVDALQRAGIRLKGDIIIAGTVGEVEQAAVDDFQGRWLDSYGVGLRYLLIHGYAADFHILGEPTGLTPWTGQMGTVWSKVTTSGTFSHTAFSDTAVNAVEEMWKLWQGLGGWIQDFRAKNVFMGVTPQVNLAAVRGGLPWRAARTPKTCSMYVDLRFPPNRYPIDIQREFKEAISNAAKDLLRSPVDIDFYVSRPGTLIPSHHPVVKAVVDAHEQVTGKKVTPKFAPPMCTDAIDANRLGIPTVNYGAAAGRSRETVNSGASGQTDMRSSEGEFVFIDDMVTCAQVYALSALRLTGMEFAELQSSRYAMPGVVGDF